MAAPILPTDNDIGVAGATAIADALKVNTTIVTIDLGGMPHPPNHTCPAYPPSWFGRAMQLSECGGVSASPVVPTMALYAALPYGTQQCSCCWDQPHCQSDVLEKGEVCWLFSLQMDLWMSHGTRA